MTQQKKHPKGKNEPPNPSLKYSALGIQMAAIIGLSAWGGIKLDEGTSSRIPWFTISFVLFGIFAALYLIIKDVTRGNKK